MPEAVPVQTGNDVLAYTGNAGLAAGAGNGGILPQQGDPFSGIAATEDQVLQQKFHTINAIRDQQAQMRIMDYKRKLQQQEDLGQFLRDTGGSVFNMKNANGQNVSYSVLPQDQAEVQKYTDAVKDYAIKHPSSYQTDPEFVKLYDQWSNIKNNAGLRSKFVSDHNLEAYNTNDPEERQNIKDWIDTHIKGSKVSDFAPLEPYMHKITADMENILPQKTIKDPANRSEKVQSRLDENGNLVYDTKDYLNENVGDFRNRITRSSKSWGDAVAKAQEFMGALQQNPQLVIAHNKSIDEINKERGYVDDQGNPVSQHYIPHVAEVQQGPDGQLRTVITKTPTPANIPDIVYSYLGESTMGGNTSSKIQKSALELAKQQADLDKAKSDAEKSDKPSTEQLKEEQYKQAVRSASEDVRKVFEKPAKQNLLTKFKNSVLPGRLGLDQSEYTIYSALPKGQAEQFIGIPQEEVKVTIPAKKDEQGNIVSPKTETTTKGGSVKPDAIYPIENKKTGERELVYVKDNQVIAKVNQKQAVANLIKHQANYQPAQYENKLAWVDKVMGEGGEAPVATTKTEKSFTPVRRTIRGVTYEKRSDGKWEIVE